MIILIYHICGLIADQLLESNTIIYHCEFNVIFINYINIITMECIYIYSLYYYCPTIVWIHHKIICGRFTHDYQRFVVRPNNCGVRVCVCMSKSKRCHGDIEWTMMHRVYYNVAMHTSPSFFHNSILLFLGWFASIIFV